MTETIKEETVLFSQYKETHDSPTVRICIQGFEPTYDIVVCVKGQPKTMDDIKGKLENLLGVCITFSEPTPL